MSTHKWHVGLCASTILQLPMLNENAYTQTRKSWQVVVASKSQCDTMRQSPGSTCFRMGHSSSNNSSISIGIRRAWPKDTCSCSMGPRISASKLSWIPDPSPPWKLPSPQEQIHKYNASGHHGHNTKACVIDYRSIQSMLRHPCGAQLRKGTRFRVDFGAGARPRDVPGSSLGLCSPLGKGWKSSRKERLESIVSSRCSRAFPLLHLGGSSRGYCLWKRPAPSSSRSRTPKLQLPRYRRFWRSALLKHFISPGSLSSGSGAAPLFPFLRLCHLPSLQKSAWR